MQKHKGKYTMILRIISASSDSLLTEVSGHKQHVCVKQPMIHLLFCKPTSELVLDTNPWGKELHGLVSCEVSPFVYFKFSSFIYLMFPCFCIGGETELLLIMQPYNATERLRATTIRREWWTAIKGKLAWMNTYFSARVCCSLIPTLKRTGWTLSNMPLWISRGSKSNKALGKGILTLNPSLWIKKQILDIQIKKQHSENGLTSRM